MKRSLFVWALILLSGFLCLRPASAQIRKDVEDSGIRIERRKGDEPAVRGRGYGPETRRSSAGIGVESGRNGVGVRTRGDAAGVRTSDAPVMKVPEPVIPAAAEAPPDEPKNPDLGTAWEQYRQGEFEEAARRFRDALSEARTAEQSREVRLGLAYAYLKLNRLTDSEKEFRRLVTDQYRLTDTLPALIHVLAERGDFDAALTYAAEMPADESRRWTRAILDRRVRTLFQATVGPAGEDASDFLTRNAEALDRCIAPELFFKAASEGRGIGADRRRAVLERLLNCESDEPLRLGIIQVLADLLPLDDAIARVQSGREGEWSDGNRRRLRRLETDLLERKRSDVLGLDTAWTLYRQGKFAAAARRFRNAIGEAPTAARARETRLGLAYAYLKLDRPTAAERQLRRLVSDRYRLSDTLPALVQLLAEGGDYDAALAYAAELPEAENRRWTRTLLEGRARALFQATVDPEGAGASAFLARNAEALDRCVAPELFFKAVSRGQDIAADQRRAVLAQLLTCEPDETLRLGIMQALADALPLDDAIARVRSGLEREWSDGNRRRLRRFEADLLKRKLVEVPPGSKEIPVVAAALLDIDPGDPDALSAWAWHAHGRDHFALAESLFERLLAVRPGDPDAARGVAYSRFQMGRYVEALAALERAFPADGPDDPEAQSLRRQIHLAATRNAYADGDWERAEAALRRALAIDPDDDGARLTLGYVLLKGGKADDALTQFRIHHRKTGNAESARARFNIHRKRGDDRAALALAETFADGNDPALRETAADYFFDRQQPHRADSIYHGPDKCYFNARSPRGEILGHYIHKSGDPGSSRFERWRFPISGSLAEGERNRWTLTVTPEILDSGSADRFPRIGRYYRFLGGMPTVRDLDTREAVFSLNLGFHREGEIDYRADVGLRGMGGAVAPTPAFDLTAETRRWKINLHRLPVTDSLLSYVGLDDPYSEDAWGRVMKTGVLAGWVQPIRMDGWISGDLAFDDYSGENTEDNQSLSLNLAAGRTFRLEGGSVLNAGWFLTAQTYRRNANFFTYGHGGYYSPDQLWATGPFVQYQTPLCRDYMIDLRASLGWVHEKTGSSPFYPFADRMGSSLAPSERAEVNGRYEADRGGKLSYRLGGQAWKRFFDRLDAGVFFRTEESADHRRWDVGIGVAWHWEARNGFIRFPGY